ncbi:hypothetical protein BDN70DRAFT_990977 [Pholiota conissans]|uniref:Uncharacterized protein n=1 Tax=Pholiota conissans TaxID=109636 RepID=A0A9P5Z8L8_9AGAR|nr:hypothetical protein BDN70DRAFT_990977 [Pholiota conissans]
MPKVATPKSSPAKRAHAAGSSPTKSASRKKKTVEVQDRATWRSSRIPPNTTITKGIAMGNYHLNNNEMKGLKFDENQTVKRIAGKDQLVAMYLYQERDVELKAWEKYGGPDSFENFLKDKMAKYYAKHGTVPKKPFPKPDTYILAGDPMASGGVYILQRPKNMPSREMATPKLLQIKAQMEARGQKWLWDAVNEAISDRECECDMFYEANIGRRGREELMTDALYLKYPPRPAFPPPSDSASFAALKNLLEQAASAESRRSAFDGGKGLEVHEDGFTGYTSVTWRDRYMTDVYDHLDAVKAEHGADGWKMARWIVYDKYVECNVGGFTCEYEGGGWELEDTASFWLHDWRLPQYRQV